MTDCFVFTINNYSEEEVAKIDAIPSYPYHIIYGKEVGAKGTPHLQGTIWHTEGSRLRRDRMEKLLGGRAYLAPCKDFSASLGYCAKDLDIHTNIPGLNIEKLTNLLRDIYPLTTCKDFIGTIIENILESTDPNTQMDLYDMPFIQSILFTHKYFHKCH